MKKLLLLTVLLCAGICVVYSQPLQQRNNGVVTSLDQNLFTGRSFRPPVFNDTTEILTAINAGVILDSCGMLYFTRDWNGYWYRACNPKHFVQIFPGGTPTTDTLAWKTSGNAWGLGSPYFGTTTNNSIRIGTNDVTRVILPSTGIVRNITSTVKPMGFDTVSKIWVYTDFPTTSTPTWQSVMTAGNQSTVNAIISGGAVLRVASSSPNSPHIELQNLTSGNPARQWNIVTDSADHFIIRDENKTANRLTIDSTGDVIIPNDLKVNSIYLDDQASPGNFGHFFYTGDSYAFKYLNDNTAFVIESNGITHIDQTGSKAWSIKNDSMTSSNVLVLQVPNITAERVIPISVNGVYADNTGNITISAGGTVTSFSAGDLSPLFTTTETNPTTTPALSFTLSNTSQYKLFGRKASGSGVPSFIDADSSAFPVGWHTEGYYDTKYVQHGQLDDSTAAIRAAIPTAVPTLKHIISQTSTNAPTVDNELVNTTGQTYTWSYISTGYYKLTATGTPFTTNKTFVIFSLGNSAGGDPTAYYTILNDSEIEIHVLEAGGVSNDILLKASLQIEIYP